MPTTGRPPIKRKSLSVQHKGRHWVGFWEEHDGKLLVSSAYGDHSEPVGHRLHLDSRAIHLFERIVEDWHVRPH
jgi:hypothetical protein